MASNAEAQSSERSERESGGAGNARRRGSGSSASSIATSQLGPLMEIPRRPGSDAASRRSASSSDDASSDSESWPGVDRFPGYATDHARNSSEDSLDRHPADSVAHRRAMAPRALTDLSSPRAEDRFGQAYTDRLLREAIASEKDEKLPNLRWTKHLLDCGADPRIVINTAGVSKDAYRMALHQYARTGANLDEVVSACYKAEDYPALHLALSRTENPQKIIGVLAEKSYREKNEPILLGLIQHADFDVNEVPGAYLRDRITDLALEKRKMPVMRGVLSPLPMHRDAPNIASSLSADTPIPALVRGDPPGRGPDRRAAAQPVPATNELATPASILFGMSSREFLTSHEGPESLKPQFSPSGQVTIVRSEHPYISIRHMPKETFKRESGNLIANTGTLAPRYQQEWLASLVDRCVETGYHPAPMVLALLVEHERLIADHPQEVARSAMIGTLNMLQDQLEWDDDGHEIIDEKMSNLESSLFDGGTQKAGGAGSLQPPVNTVPASLPQTAQQFNTMSTQERNGTLAQMASLAPAEFRTNLAEWVAITGQIYPNRRQQWIQTLAKRCASLDDCPTAFLGNLIEGMTNLVSNHSGAVQKDGVKQFINGLRAIPEEVQAPLKEKIDALEARVGDIQNTLTTSHGKIAL